MTTLSLAMASNQNNVKILPSQKQHQPCKHPKYQFLPHVDKLTLSKISQKNKKLLQQKIMHLSQKQYRQLRKKVFPYLKSTQALQLRIIVCGINDSIFRQISHIRFQNLVMLNFLNNQITNMQGLAFLQAPNLKRIGLAGNYIVNATKCLKKLQFKNLELLDLNTNLINQVDVGRLEINTNQFQFRVHILDQARFTVEDISFYAKLKSWQRGRIFDYLMYYEQPSIKFTNILQQKCSKVLRNKIQLPLNGKDCI